MEEVMIEGSAQGQLALTTSADHTSALSAGRYDLWCDVDCYVKVAMTASDVTTSTGYLLRANNTVPFRVNVSRRIGGVVAAGTGTLRYHRIGE